MATRLRKSKRANIVAAEKAHKTIRANGGYVEIAKKAALTRKRNAAERERVAKRAANERKRARAAKSAASAKSAD